MKSSLAALEVELKGQKPRLFLFDAREITIGFTSRADLPLEPSGGNGAEVRLQAQPGQGWVLDVVSEPGAFQLNGMPCKSQMKVGPGDLLITGEYSIRIQNLPGVSPRDSDLESQSARKAAQAGLPAVARAGNAEVVEEGHTMAGEPPCAPAPRVQRGKMPPDTASQSALSYLYLFFEPVRDYLLDDDVSEIMINGPRQIYIERRGRLEPIAARFTSEQALQAAVINVARSVGRLFDKDNPRLDARLPDGSRVHAVMPPLSRVGTVVAIRKFRRERLTIEELIRLGSVSPEAARVLEMVVKLGRNLIVSGATSSGKTSVLNVLSAWIPEHERILVLEDASELQLRQIHKVCFETRKADEFGKGEVTMRDLLHSALRLRPDRIILGEIRGGEALDLLQAMNTGHEGCMSTVHANSARDSLFRLETCALLSGIEIPLSALREQVAAAVHVVIQTARLFDGTRKITGITEVVGLKDREYVMEDILVFQPEGLTAEGKIQGRHLFTGYKPTFLKAALQRGFDCSGLFGR
jgi:pilus assembly protein CpaF